MQRMGVERSYQWSSKHGRRKMRSRGLCETFATSRLRTVERIGCELSHVIDQTAQRLWLCRIKATSIRRSSASIFQPVTNSRP